MVYLLKMVDLSIEIDGLPIQNGYFPIEIDGLPMKNGDFPIEIDGLPIQNGDFPIEIDCLPIKNGGSFHRNRWFTYSKWWIFP